MALAVFAVPEVHDVIPENIQLISHPTIENSSLEAPKKPILEAPDAEVKRYHADICSGVRSAALPKVVDFGGYAESDSVKSMIDRLNQACGDDDFKMSIWNFQTIVVEIFSLLEALADITSVDLLSDDAIPEILKPFKPIFDEARQEEQDTTKLCKQYSKDSLLQVEKPKGDHPLLVQAWDAHKKQQEYAEQCICTDYGTAQYCSGTPECSESVKATALLAFGLSIGAHAYKDGGAQGAGVFGDKKFHDALHKITVKVQGTVRDHRQQKSLLQTNNIPELCARLAVMQYENMADYICHINCNGYKGAHEISAGCDIPLGAVEINVELHITGCTIHVRNK